MLGVRCDIDIFKLNTIVFKFINREVYITILASCPLSNALCSVWDLHKVITSQTFPISKLCGWKHTAAFHRQSETNRHQTLRHLWQYWCYGNRSVIGNRGGLWTFQNCGDIALSPTSLETTLTNKPPKYYTETRGAQNLSSSRKRGNISNRSEPP